ncbi:hypothetical protein Q75_04095 [Bacillus coahuilensis p1.1.43]|uniref:Uncharacterized protein n=1 Tax=Bacillus coahuilensis p1.1.43 TaxID=1150625 RepID=A0A147KAY3_9BACI|nr:hypothetical protein [Bacillus coahuilensis]KUP07947.1 hypothetical protein Q75_04095 [Bacillus coahuilensis p1.1.43]
MVSVLLVFIVMAGFILYFINTLTFTLCTTREMSEEKQASVFRTINILITILLVSSYIEILFSS